MVSVEMTLFATINTAGWFFNSFIPYGIIDFTVSIILFRVLLSVKYYVIRCLSRTSRSVVSPDSINIFSPVQSNPVFNAILTMIKMTVTHLLMHIEII